MKMFIVLALAVVLFAGFCQAATFDADLGGEIRANLDVKTGEVVLSWIKIGKIAAVEQYLTRKYQGKWIRRIKVNGNTTTFNGLEGDRFNLIDDQGRYLMLTPEMAAAKLKPFQLEGISIDCSNSDGCALQLAPGKGPL